MGREDDIRVIAYNIWEEEGCIQGRDCDHWFRAETIWEESQKAEEAIVNTKIQPKAEREIRKGKKKAAGRKH